MEELNEYELLYMARQNDDWAIYKLQKLIEPFIMKKYGEIHNSWRNFEFDEAFQAGLLGLYDAISYYRQDKNMAFHSFAILCIERRMIVAVREYKKNIPPNSITLIPLDKKLNDNENTYLAEIIKDPRSNHAQSVMMTSMLEDAYKLLNKEIDKKVFIYKIKGYSYNEIAEKLQIKNKDVDNSIQRIRKKISYLFD